ncbi:5-oxoprolinase-like [Clavelina lepadiformis]|uniref:5-oxoprolinase-like n=1 Tax=Clavelina lepadiformis TaxID=159417 RepID=UPI004042F937
MSIAEQMGRILQRTAISTNIKERLDFSCALFGPDGRLVSNAPHIPVHLGAMQDGVQYQMWAIDINEGDCILSNHPYAGGVHLPVYSQVTAFLTLPGEFTSCSRTHNLHGNLADLRALVAANQKGIHLVQELISRSATYDFEGTSPMVINKLNAPRAISKSVIIHSLRCMVGYDIPLNQGCLAPIHLQIPKWSILDPDYQISGRPQEPLCSFSTGGDGVLRKILF